MRKRAAVLTAGVGMVLAGCGGDGDSGNGVAELGVDEIFAEAQEAIDAAETARIVGTGSIEGEAMELDLTYGPDSGVGTIGLGGAEFELTSVDGNVYMFGSSATWEQLGGGAFASMLADKYVLIPADDPSFSEMTEFLDLSAMGSELLVPDGEVTKGDETEINGQAVIALVDEDGSTLYVATTGEPLPVQVTPPEGESGTMDFEWGVEVDVTAPDEADVVDLSEIAQSG